MNRRLLIALIAGLLLALIAAVTFGEVGLSLGQYVQAVTDPGSPAGQVLWLVRAPRAVCAAAVGAALGLSGAVMQGLLRNPLADPGVLGVSATSALAAALGIVLGMAAIPGAVEALALVGAGGGGVLLIAFAARVAAPEALILFGVALSSFAGAVTALIFNLSPSPVASAEVMNWLLGSVQNRGWNDVLWAALPMLTAAALASLARPERRLSASARRPRARRSSPGSAPTPA
ncbi:MAG: iron ABC transporter permease, partial [Brevundimonas sp.]